MTTNRKLVAVLIPLVVVLLALVVYIVGGGWFWASWGDRSIVDELAGDPVLNLEDLPGDIDRTGIRKKPATQPLWGGYDNTANEIVASYDVELICAQEFVGPMVDQLAANGWSVSSIRCGDSLRTAEFRLSARRPFRD